MTNKTEELKAEVERLNSELTKARELNGLLFEQARKRDALLNNEANECSGCPRSCPNNEGFGCDCIAHQSVPAAKGGEFMGNCEVCGHDRIVCTCKVKP